MKEKEEEKKTIGYAVVDLQPVLGLTLTWLGLGCSLTDINNFDRFWKGVGEGPISYFAKLPPKEPMAQ